MTLSTDTLTPRDELAMRAPITFDMARDLWQQVTPGTGPNLRDHVERRTFWAFWWTLCLEWADVGLATREEPSYAPGESATEDRRMDRQINTLGWWDYRITKPLANAGITTLRTLLALDVYKLDAIKGIGPDGLRDIINRLNYEGLRLAPRLASASPVVDHEPAPGVGSEEVGS